MLFSALDVVIKTVFSGLFLLESSVRKNKENAKNRTDTPRKIATLKNQNKYTTWFARTNTCIQRAKADKYPKVNTLGYLSAQGLCVKFESVYRDGITQLSFYVVAAWKSARDNPFRNAGFAQAMNLVKYLGALGLVVDLMVLRHAYHYE